MSSNSTTICYDFDISRGYVCDISRVRDISRDYVRDIYARDISRDYNEFLSNLYTFVDNLYEYQSQKYQFKCDHRPVLFDIPLDFSSFSSFRQLETEKRVADLLSDERVRQEFRDRWCANAYDRHVQNARTMMVHLISRLDKCQEEIDDEELGDYDVDKRERVRLAMTLWNSIFSLWSTLGRCCDEDDVTFVCEVVSLSRDSLEDASLEDAQVVRNFFVEKRVQRLESFKRNLIDRLVRSGHDCDVIKEVADASFRAARSLSIAL